jgi:hypothetical protein
MGDELKGTRMVVCNVVTMAADSKASNLEAEEEVIVTMVDPRSRAPIPYTFTITYDCKNFGYAPSNMII